MLDIDNFSAYWQGLPLQANLLISLNLLGALLLGMLVGYERAYHGRAAGLRTYGLISMASCALTVMVGYSSYWLGGMGSPTPPDPTRVIQGIVSGIGFVCAGAIMRDGLSINGLTTASSLWASSVIGILVGVGFYGAALVLAVLVVLSMIVGRSLTDRLPTKESFGVILTFKPEAQPQASRLAEAAQASGYTLNTARLAIAYDPGKIVWRFPIEAVQGRPHESRAELAKAFSELPYLISFSLEPSRH